MLEAAELLVQETEDTQKRLAESHAKRGDLKKRHGAEVLELIDLKLKDLARGWGYYSTDVKLCHIWRGNHRTWHRPLPQECGTTVADRAATLAPIVDDARWGPCMALSGN